jgi:adenosylcobinamide-phosphate synthase
MSFLSLLAVFVFEQLRPLAYRRLVDVPFRALAQWFERRFNAGRYTHGLLAWVSLVLPVLVTVALLVWLLAQVGSPALLICNIAVLYFCMGFRRPADTYADIQLALRLGEHAHARRLLTEWLGTPISEAPAELPRLAIETALRMSHRRVFAIVFWFVLLPGPLGALLYRLAALLAESWRPSEDGKQFAHFSQQAFRVLDWLPQRATALAFAVVGNFEDALYSWRNRPPEDDAAVDAIVLASAAGTLGIQLCPSCGTVVMKTLEDRMLNVGAGRSADVDSMQSAVGLLWRAAMLWLSLLFLLGLAGLAG